MGSCPEAVWPFDPAFVNVTSLMEQKFHQGFHLMTSIFVYTEKNLFSV
jgi:hypothetical protein